MNTAIAIDSSSKPLASDSTGTTRTLKPLSYIEPDCRLSLRAGLAEYHSSIEGLLGYDNISSQAQQLFARHDIAHIVFGCDTSVSNEAMVDVWTMFGTDVGIVEYLRYLRTQEATNIIFEMGAWKMLLASVRAVPLLIRAFRATRRMHKRWPWADHDRYLDTPLHDLRAEFGIELVQSS